MSLEELEEIKQLKHAGKTYAQIASQYSSSTEAIKTLAKRHNFTGLSRIGRPALYSATTFVQLTDTDYAQLTKLALAQTKGNKNELIRQLIQREFDKTIT